MNGQRGGKARLWDSKCWARAPIGKLNLKEMGGGKGPQWELAKGNKIWTSLERAQYPPWNGPGEGSGRFLRKTAAVVERRKVEEEGKQRGEK